jgi:predicted dehydrogenase
MTQDSNKPTTNSLPKAEASRRGFLKTGVTASALAATLPISRSAWAQGSDTIRLGLIGCGGRGTGAAGQALDTNSESNRVKLTAVADPFKFRADNAIKELKNKHKDNVDAKAFIGVDGYKEVLASDVDMVILTSPPGFRPLHFEAAVKAGKHVFMEKPVATDAPGVRRVLEANKIAKDKKLAVAVGLQRHHQSDYKSTIKMLKEGAIGDIILTRAYWNGDGVWTRNRQANQTELEYQLNNWYYFNWLSGDHICEQHIHNLDVINWLMDGPPAEAQGQGGRQVRTGEENGQIYDHHFVEFTYPNGTKLLSQCRHIPGCWNSVSEFAHGTNGWADISGGKIYNKKNEVVWKSPAGENGWAQEHVDLFAQIRKGEIPNEGDYGATSTMTSIMGRMATYTGKLLKWDQCINSQVGLANFDAIDSFDDEAPIKPDEKGRYWIPTPGQDTDLVV